MENGHVFMLLNDSRRKNGRIPSGLGKPSAQQEGDSIKVLVGKYGNESSGWRRIYCFSLPGCRWSFYGGIVLQCSEYT